MQDLAAELNDDLPAPFAGDPETIRRVGTRQGMGEDAIVENLNGLAEAIWNAEEGRAFAMLDQDRLNEQGHEILLARLWKRHQKIWGQFAKRP